MQVDVRRGLAREADEPRLDDGLGHLGLRLVVGPDPPSRGTAEGRRARKTSDELGEDAARQVHRGFRSRPRSAGRAAGRTRAPGPSRSIAAFESDERGLRVDGPAGDPADELGPSSPACTGRRSVPAIRRTWASSVSTTSSSPFFAGSFASAQGARTSTCWFACSTSVIASTAPFWRSSASSAAQTRSTAARASFTSGDAETSPVDAASLVLVRHRDRAREQVAEAVREVGVRAHLEPVLRVLEVLAPLRLAAEVEADRVRRVLPRERGGLDDVARALAHAALRQVDVSVAEDRARQLEARGEQHRGPDDAVEPRDVLADHVEVRGPPLRERRGVVGEARAGDVVDQRVEPDVDLRLRVERERDAPGRRRARDRDVLEAALELRELLVLPELGLDEVGVLAVVLDQAVAPGREPEEPVLLLEPLRLARQVLGAAAVLQLLRALERLAARAVPALVLALEQVATLADAA